MVGSPKTNESVQGEPLATCGRIVSIRDLLGRRIVSKGNLTELGLNIIYICYTILIYFDY